MGFLPNSRSRARRLHEKAQQLSDSGMDDEALRLYEKALRIDPNRPTTLYNVGLIHKYRLNWEASLDHNAKAYSLAPDNEAARWNYAIAATALRQWQIARRLWAENGIDVEGDKGPINMDLGLTPIRLNPDDDGEVVWGTRIDPVRARIENIPFPESGFRHGDIVLHDGAAVGYRVLNGSKRGVFNVLELFQRSAYNTYVVVLQIENEIALESALKTAADLGIEAEDWTGNIQVLCRQCSEGVPHEDHDKDLKAEWNPDHRIGVAAEDQHLIGDIVSRWRQMPQVEVIESSLALEA